MGLDLGHKQMQVFFSLGAISEVSGLLKVRGKQGGHHLEAMLPPRISRFPYSFQGVQRMGQCGTDPPTPVLQSYINRPSNVHGLFMLIHLRGYQKGNDMPKSLSNFIAALMSRPGNCSILPDPKEKDLFPNPRKLPEGSYPLLRTLNY